MNLHRVRIAVLLIPLLPLFGHAQSEWSLLLSRDLQNDAAIAVALEDLKETGIEYGITFSISDIDAEFVNAILVGSPDRNLKTADLVESRQITLQGIEDPQGYEIVTKVHDGGKVMVVAGGSVMGDVYGLYWIRDRLRVFQEIPAINVRREPDLPIRYTRISVKDEEDIRRAMRYGINLVFGENTLNLVPWNAEPEHSENEEHRARTRELAAYAHSLHMKFLAFGTEFTYHPSLLEDVGATLSPSDPFFWDAVQTKFRRLLEAIPEIDGVGTFTGEEQQFWGNYRTFDPMHHGEGCEWTLEKRYRTFVKKISNVVVGEFDKMFLHRTWCTNTYEQHSRPAIYKSIFTEEVPTKNLFLIPSFTQNDRWWYQAYNPTFNLTPHKMMVVFESLDYHASGNCFPTYPGPFFQGGLQTMLGVENTNLEGGSLDLPRVDDTSAANLTAYTVSRLEWDRNESVEEIARDFASIHFGKEAAGAMAKVYLLSPAAYKYGLYIEPAAHGEFNSLPHIRVGMFTAEGYSSIDNGKEHIEFLRKIYLSCKPWLSETYKDLDYGLDLAKMMKEEFNTAKDLIENGDLAKETGDLLDLTRLLIETNNLYVKTFCSYFQYREDPNPQAKEALRGYTESLASIREQFSEAPGFRFQLFGVDRIIENSRQALEDLEKAEKRLRDAPNSTQIERVVAERCQQYREILEEHADEAVRMFHGECRIDGRDMIEIKGKDLRQIHLRWDPMSFRKCDMLQPLPEQSVTVIPKSIETRPMHPFILEQPSEENGYTVKVYLNDIPGGAGWWKFDLYYIPKSPAELGLRTDW